MKFTRRIDLDIDVVTAARQRIKNIFSNDCEIVFSTSGGKDSICVHDLLFSMASAGEIDKSKLRVIFVDEEAIYPCIEKRVLDMRRQWMLLGVPFDWYAMEFKHYNCLNQLSQDESFICFDRTRADSWVRLPPPFALRWHPDLRPGVDTYQDFCKRVFKHAIIITGVRAAESVQRAQNLERGSIETTGMAYPVYDWRDVDVWKYIYDNGLEIPESYIHMYQCGISKQRLRISQFFSVDTVGSLVKMCEVYPDLFNRICAREPNAYMAMLYYDTELFRRSKRKDNTDYKAKALDLIKHPERLGYSGKGAVLREVKNLYVQFGAYWNQKNWRDVYQILIAGDPKKRSLRALRTQSVINRNNKNAAR